MSNSKTATEKAEELKTRLALAAADSMGGVAFAALAVDELEQAIAATLGDDGYEQKMDELLCRLTNGKWSKTRSYSVDFMVSCVDEAYEDATLGGEKLTAEQVRKCVRVGACDHGLWGALDEDTDWETIADELNAELGSGTCELTEVEIDGYIASEWMLDRFFVYDSVYECSCGETFGHVARNRPNFCPKCGRKVVSA